jgi:hypothetical protein
LFTLQVKLAELEACLDSDLEQLSMEDLVRILEKIFLGTTIAVDG